MKQTELAALLGASKQSVYNKINSTNNSNRMVYKALLLLPDELVKNAISLVKAQEEQK